MSTISRLGPADHLRAVTREELAEARYQEGYRYEIIEGRLYVSPVPNPSHDEVVEWLFSLLLDYSREHAEVVNKLSQRARVFVPNRPDLTVPEPEIAAYHDWPRNLPRAQIRWEDHSPILVVEVVSEDDPDKDLDRNVQLYRLVPSIREYWIVDPRPDPDQPELIVYRRRSARWQRLPPIPFGGEYTTRLLPGFRLRMQ